MENHVVFGGTFDPIHEGHLSVVKRLADSFALVVIAPTKSNPWKESPEASLEQRLEMIQLVLEHEKLGFSSSPAASGIWLSGFEYSYAKDFAEYCRSSELAEILPGELHWAVGEDSAETVDSWRDWKALSVPLEVLPVTISVHATGIRGGDDALHPGIKKYATARGLYGT